MADDPTTPPRRLRERAPWLFLTAAGLAFAGSGSACGHAVYVNIARMEGGAGWEPLADQILWIALAALALMYVGYWVGSRAYPRLSVLVATVVWPLALLLVLVTGGSQALAGRQLAHRCAEVPDPTACRALVDMGDKARMSADRIDALLLETCERPDCRSCAMAMERGLLTCDDAVAFGCPRARTCREPASGEEGSAEH